MQIAALVLGLTATVMAAPQSFKPIVAPGQYSVYLYSENNFGGSSIGASAAYKKCTNVSNFKAKSIFLYQGDRCRLWNVAGCPEEKESNRFTVDSDTASFEASFSGKIASLYCQQT